MSRLGISAVAERLVFVGLQQVGTSRPVLGEL